jgi:hypothetical protein
MRITATAMARIIRAISPVLTPFRVFAIRRIFSSFLIVSGVIGDLQAASLDEGIIAGEFANVK